MLTKGHADDRGVERAAKATVAGADHQQVDLLRAGAGQQLRSAGAADHVAREISQHASHLLSEGPARFSGHLGAAQLGCGDHLHGLGDLLRRLHRGDAVPQVLQARHRVRSRSVPRGLSSRGSRGGGWCSPGSGKRKPDPGRSRDQEGSVQAMALATPSTTLLSLPAFSSDRSFEAAIESSRSLCLLRRVARSWSSNGRTFASGSLSR